MMSTQQQYVTVVTRFTLDDSVIPDAENLKVTLERASLPFLEDKIAPCSKDGKNVFVVSTRWYPTVPL